MKRALGYIADGALLLILIILASIGTIAAMEWLIVHEIIPSVFELMLKYIGS